MCCHARSTAAGWNRRLTSRLCIYAANSDDLELLSEWRLDQPRCRHPGPETVRSGDPRMQPLRRLRPSMQVVWIRGKCAVGIAEADHRGRLCRRHFQGKLIAKGGLTAITFHLVNNGHDGHPMGVVLDVGYPTGDRRRLGGSTDSKGSEFADKVPTLGQPRAPQPAHFQLSRTDAELAHRTQSNRLPSAHTPQGQSEFPVARW